MEQKDAKENREIVEICSFGNAKIVRAHEKRFHLYANHKTTDLTHRNVYSLGIKMLYAAARETRQEVVLMPNGDKIIMRVSLEPHRKKVKA